MIYLASPYTHTDLNIMEKRFCAVELVTATLLRQRQWVYSPIVHCHALAIIHKMPKDFSFWRDYNIHMLAKADELYVLCLDGWKESRGLTAEVLWWKRQYGDGSITYLEPSEFAL